MGRARGQQPAAVVGGSLRGAAAPAPMRVDVYSPGGNHGQPAAGELPDYDGLLLEFDRDLADWEREQVRGVVSYWAYLPYTSDGTEEQEWLSPRHFWVDASSHRSRSSDWRARDVFGLLDEFLTEGTPERKDGTRKWPSVGETAARVVLNHPGDSHPPLPQPPLDFTRTGRQGPLLTVADPRDLLRIRR